MQLFLVDAFSNEPFRGNPAGVCLVDGPYDDGWMQAVAAELNLSETAFVEPLEPDADSFGLRWFSPITEVDLCGHATIATAHTLWETGHGGERLVFETRSGPLAATRDGDWIHLDFPALPAEAIEAPSALAEALGAEPVWVGRNRADYLVEVAEPSTVRALAPDVRALMQFPAAGVIVTAAGGAPGADFVSRFFAPNLGIDEDPVTGAAHCCLGPFWSERLGKDEVVGYQASARGGYVRVRSRGERVTLAGQAVTVLRGELSVPAEPAVGP